MLMSLSSLVMSLPWKSECIAARQAFITIDREKKNKGDVLFHTFSFILYGQPRHSGNYH